MRPIYCGNFEYDAHRSDLERLFGRYGKVDGVDMKSGTVHVVLLASMSYGSRCAACKYLRRKCPPDCSLAPYFPSNNPQRFASVHRIYGASNVVKMLQKIESHDLRVEAANSLHFEAQRRIEDPVYGCVGMISQLHQQIQRAETELAKVHAEITLKRSATISAQEINHDHHHYDQLLEMESDLNNILLQGQSSV